MLGTGTYEVYTADRGGSPLRFAVPFRSLSFEYVLDGSGRGQANMPSFDDSGTFASCCEVLADTEPWRHELAIYRGTDDAWFGPVWDVTSDDPNGVISASDLFSWTERRFISEDLFYSMDLADIFGRVFDKALEPDPTPNVTVSTRACGSDGTRRYIAKDFQRVSDILGELARTAVDFTTVGRKVLAGGLSALLPSGDLILHDDGVVRAGLSKDGSQFASDVALFGAIPEGRQEPVTGRATRGTDTYGLVQESVADLLVEDEFSAQEAAEARIARMQPAPRRLSATLFPDAAFKFSDLIPGRRVDCRLTGVIGCGDLVEVMRLQRVGVTVSASASGQSETITLDLIPLGEEDA